MVSLQTSGIDTACLIINSLRLNNPFIDTYSTLDDTINNRCIDCYVIERTGSGGWRFKKMKREKHF